MKSKLGHLTFYVSDMDTSYKLYKKLLEYLDYKEIVKQDWGFAFTNGGIDLWFEGVDGKYKKDGYHRKRVGLNHLAFRVNSKENVDKFCKEFLEKNRINTLYGSPKAYPEYDKDYYAAYFEDPDRIKLEVAYYP